MLLFIIIIHRPPHSGDILPHGVTHGFIANTTQQGDSFVSHLATSIAHVLTNVAFADVHLLQKFYSTHIHV